MRNGTNDLLKMPSNYLNVDENEMACVMGGGINLATLKDFLNKSVCASVARTYVKYNMKLLSKSLLPKAREIYESAKNGIYIEDAVDSRQSYLEMIWKL